MEAAERGGSFAVEEDDLDARFFLLLCLSNAKVFSWLSRVDFFRPPVDWALRFWNLSFICVTKGAAWVEMGVGCVRAGWGELSRGRGIRREAFLRTISV